MKLDVKLQDAGAITIDGKRFGANTQVARILRGIILEKSEKEKSLQSWHVYVNGVHYTVVYYSICYNAEKVKQDLINNSGFPPEAEYLITKKYKGSTLGR